MMTRTYIAGTATLWNDETFNRLTAYVNKDRQAKIDRCAKKKDKILSLAAGLVLEKALDDVGVSDRAIIVGDNGKPYLAGGEVFFNLSHSGDKVMCALSDTEVGCDVQKTGEISRKIADRFFSASERAFLNGITDEKDRTDMFFRLWTLKESYIKMLGTGFKTPMGSFSVSIADNIPVFDGNSDKYYFKEYSLSDGYKYAVCAEFPCFEDEAAIVEIG